MQTAHMVTTATDACAGDQTRHDTAWEQTYIDRLRRKAAALGCDENLRLAEYVMVLERRLEALEATHTGF